MAHAELKADPPESRTFHSPMTKKNNSLRRLDNRWGGCAMPQLCLHLLHASERYLVIAELLESEPYARMLD